MLIRKLVGGLLAGLLLASIAGTGSVLAYNGNAAASWADSHVFSECPMAGNNSAYGYCYANDCTAFVSKALHYGGGFSYVGSRSNGTTDDHYWWNVWISYAGWYNSNSWSVTPDLYNFLMWHYPGGWLTTTATFANGLLYNASSGVHAGDVLFYDWGGGGGRSHAAIQVATGWAYDGVNFYGDLVDAHTNTRQHVPWTLLPYATSQTGYRADRFTVYGVVVDFRNG